MDMPHPAFTFRALPCRPHRGRRLWMLQNRRRWQVQEARLAARNLHREASLGSFARVVASLNKKSTEPAQSALFFNERY